MGKKSNSKFNIFNGLKASADKGFTLVEMVVVLVVLSIMLGLSAAGLLSWQDWASWKKQNEYAEALFISAQNQMAEYNANGYIKQFSKKLVTNGKYMNELNQSQLSNITAEDGTYLDMLKIWYESSVKSTDAEGNTTYTAKENAEIYQGTICYAMCTASDYKNYKNGYMSSLSNPSAAIVFELLEDRVYDTSILNAAICIEFSPEEGQVFSVLYSSENESFTYSATDDHRGEVSISSRVESYRNDRMVGYYGVDTLARSIKGGSKDIAITDLMLNNEETLNLSFKVDGNVGAYGLLDYKIDVEGVYDGAPQSEGGKVTGDGDYYKELTFTIPGGSLKTLSKGPQPIMVDVTKFVYEANGNNKEHRKSNPKSQNLGKLPILAWVEPDGTVRVVLDAVDVKATASLVEDFYSKYYKRANPSGHALLQTQSFHRFGLEADRIRCTLTASGANYNETSPRWSKPEDVYFAAVNLDVTKNTTLGDVYELDIANSRHLYNVRFLEDVSVEAIRTANDKPGQGHVSSNKDYKFCFSDNTTLTCNFRVIDNIDWGKTVKSGYVFNNSSVYKTAGDNKPVEFTSIGQLRLNDTFGYLKSDDTFVRTSDKKFTISNIDISLINNYNSDRGIYEVAVGGKAGADLNGLLGAPDGNNGSNATFDPTGKPVGLFVTNLGHIENINMDNVRVSGCEKVGAICGSNAGTLTEIEILNTGIDTPAASNIVGETYVGGVMGYQAGVKNKSDATGKNEIVITKLVNNAKVTGNKYVGGIVGMLELTKNADYTISVSECENYGALVADTKLDKSTDTAKKDPRFIGGIVGLANNKTEDINKLSISKCVSSPEYGESDLDSILSAGNAETKFRDEFLGVYVGGIVGYNYYGLIENCSTEAKKGKTGYIFGNEFVGGIVGYNQGPASGIKGRSDNERGVNEANVLGVKYVGGIVGCNANIMKGANPNGGTYGTVDSDDIIITPDNRISLDVKIDNWVNKGIVFAADSYAGGITGYNSGWIFNCVSDIETDRAHGLSQKTYSGNYAGGIAGYNNGIIGNTNRTVSDDHRTSTKGASNGALKVVCFITGDNYVGGIVGYNDYDAIVEDYAVTGGSILGTGNFVGGYAGFNSSILLLQEKNVDAQGKVTYSPRRIVSSPQVVNGNYYVGGTIGGNILSTYTYEGENGDGGESSVGGTTNLCKATLERNQDGGNNLLYYENISIINNSENAITDWYIEVSLKKGTKYQGNEQEWFGTVKRNLAESTDTTDVYVITPGETWFKNIAAGGKSTYQLIFLYPDRAGAAEFKENRIKLFYKGGDGSTNDYKEFGNQEITIKNKHVDNSCVEVVVGEKQGDNYGWGSDTRTNTANITISNPLDSEIIDLRMEIDKAPGIKLKYATGCKYEETDDKWIITVFNGGVTELKKKGEGNSSNTFSVAFDGVGFKDDANDWNRFFDDLYNKNNITFIYYDTKIGGGDGGPTSLAEIEAQFVNDNAFGVVRGTAFTGGYMGYNIFVGVKEQANVKPYIQSMADELVSYQKETTEAGLKSLSDRVEAVGVKATSETEDNHPSNTTFKIQGKQDEDTTNFGSVIGDIYVAGVIGYNDKNTTLKINDVTNKTPVTARKAISNNEQLATAKRYDGTDFTYSYAGGIIGKVSENTTITRCKNAKTGRVTSAGTYTGGICEVNEGTVTECSSSNIGSGTLDYVGAICGLNKSNGTVDKCVSAGTTTSGKCYVSAIVVDNYGTITDPVINEKSKLNVSGSASAAEKLAVAGMVAAHNHSDATITVSQPIERFTIAANGSNVGGLVGINEGAILGSSGKTVIPAGSIITGNKNVGGVVGLNIDTTVQYFENHANVTANEGGAGGIVGFNSKSENATTNPSILDCDNYGEVVATKSGNAGGITSENSGLINACADYANVKSANGNCGGIAAANNRTGEITNCTVEGKDNTLEFSSKNIVGGMVATNSGTIKELKIKNVEVYNYTSSNKSEIGIVCGRNEAITETSDAQIVIVASGTINLENSEIEQAKAETYTNYSFVGGVAGVNEGSVVGNTGTDSNKRTTIKPQVGFKEGGNGTIATFGGVVGANYGNIERINVEAIIVGDMGDGTNAYAGVAGLSGMSEVDFAGNDFVMNDNILVKDCSFAGRCEAAGSANNMVYVGGIVGVNGLTSTVRACTLKSTANVNDNQTVIGSTEESFGNVKNKVNGTGVAYVGGIVAVCYGEVYDCDNLKENSNVLIRNRSGSTGGIVGKAYENSVVTGTDDTHKMTTGKNWYVLERTKMNDTGIGGIIGWTLSHNDMAYMENWAEVESIWADVDLALGGLVGRIDNDSNKPIRLEHSVNYADVTGWSSEANYLKYGKESAGYNRENDAINKTKNIAAGRVGGCVGTTKYKAIYYNDCVNWGRIAGMRSGGIVGYMNLPAVGEDFYFTDCINYGRIVSTATDNYASGIMGSVAGSWGNGTNRHGSGKDNSKIPEIYFIRCVNTGVIQTSDTSANSRASGICGPIERNKADGRTLASPSVGRISLYQCMNLGAVVCTENTTGKNAPSNCIMTPSYTAKSIRDCLSISNSKYPLARGAKNEFAATELAKDDYYESNNFYIGTPNRSDVVAGESVVKLDVTGTTAGYTNDEGNTVTVLNNVVVNPLSDEYINDLSEDTYENQQSNRILLYKSIKDSYAEYVKSNYPNSVRAPQNITWSYSSGVCFVDWDYNTNKIDTYFNPDVYAYEVSYTLTKTNGEVIRRTENIGQRNYYRFYQEDASFAGANVKLVITAIAGDGTRASTDEINYTMKVILPSPEVHLELVSDNKYIAILDNQDDYKDINGNIYNVKIKATYTGYSTQFMASRGYSLGSFEEANKKITLDSLKPTIADSKSTQLVAFAEEFPKANVNYVTSPQSKPEANVLSSTYHLDKNISVEGIKKDTGTAADKKENIIQTTFDGTNGYKGATLDTLNYTFVINDKSGTNAYDQYIASDIVVYDEELGFDVSYGHTLSHVKYNSGVNTVIFGSLPSDVVNADTVTVRAYPWYSQLELFHYGHEVAVGLTREQVADKNRVDNNHYRIDSDGVTVIKDENKRIFDENGELVKGYLVYVDENGKYNIYYDAFLEYEDEIPNKTGLQKEVFTSTKDTDGNIVSYTGSRSGKTYPLATTPRIESLTTDAAGYEYTFKWDSETYSVGDEYSLELVGVTLDDKEVSIETVPNVAANEYTFVDVNHNWNYKTLILQVSKAGAKNTDETTKILPSVAEKSFKVKLKLSEISQPVVDVNNVDGVYLKDRLDYLVTWSGITDAYELQETAGYLITVKSRAATSPTPTHYFYAGSENVASLPEGTVVVTANASEGVCSSVINLDDFASEEEIEVSIKAVALATAENYQSGPEGVESSTNIAKRLDVPNVADSDFTLKLKTTQASGYTVDDINEGMVTKFAKQATYNDASIDQSNTKYDVAIAVFGSEPEGADTDKTRYTSAEWADNAEAIIYSKTAPYVIDANYAYDVDIISTAMGINLSDYAGKYLKVVVRANSTNYISSPWTDEDPEGVSVNYRWFKVPKANLQEPKIEVVSSTNVQFEGENWIQKECFNFKASDYAKYMDVEFVFNNNDTASIYIVNTGTKLSPNYDIYYELSETPFFKMDSANIVLVGDRLLAKAGTIKPNESITVFSRVIPTVTAFSKDVTSALTISVGADGVFTVVTPDILGTSTDGAVNYTNTGNTYTVTKTVSVVAVADSNDNQYGDSKVSCLTINDGTNVVNTVTNDLDTTAAPEKPTITSVAVTDAGEYSVYTFDALNDSENPMDAVVLVYVEETDDNGVNHVINAGYANVKEYTKTDSSDKVNGFAIPTTWVTAVTGSSGKQTLYVLIGERTVTGLSKFTDAIKIQ